MASGAANSDSMYVDNRRAPKKFNFWRGIYNKDKNYILGRSPTNWGKIRQIFIIFIWWNRTYGNEKKANELAKCWITMRRQVVDQINGLLMLTM